MSSFRWQRTDACHFLERMIFLAFSRSSMRGHVNHELYFFEKWQPHQASSCISWIGKCLNFQRCNLHFLQSFFHSFICFQLPSLTSPSFPFSPLPILFHFLLRLNFFLLLSTFLPFSLLLLRSVLEEESVITTTQLPEESMMQNIDSLENTWSRPRYSREDSDSVTKACPAIARQLQGPTRVPESGRAHFEARVTPPSDSNLIVDWFKDGLPLNSSEIEIRLEKWREVCLPLRPTDADLFQILKISSEKQTADRNLSRKKLSLQ